MAKAADRQKSPDFRYERKFLVTDLSLQQLELLIRFNPALFSVMYPPRSVNSIYFDHPDLRFYQENVAGLMNRTKVRIRWYGDTFGPIQRPVLEKKIKRGLLGYKESYPLAPFTLNTQSPASKLV